MKRIWSIVLMGSLLIPSTGLAKDWNRWHGHGRSSPTVVVVRHHHNNGGAIAAGVLGGIITGVILDRVFTPHPEPVYALPPPTPRDPYEDGYWEGYRQGLERGRRERHEQGRRQGYEDGYERGQSDRISSKARLDY